MGHNELLYYTIHFIERGSSVWIINQQNLMGIIFEI